MGFLTDHWYTTLLETSKGKLKAKQNPNKGGKGKGNSMMNHGSGRSAWRSNDIRFWLDATFVANNQSYTNGNILDGPSDGVFAGSLEVEGNNYQIVSNTLETYGVGGSDASNSMWTPTLTRELGRVAFVKVTPSETSDWSNAVAWSRSTDASGTSLAVMCNTTPGIRFRTYTTDAGAVDNDLFPYHGGYVAGNELLYALMLGGFDSDYKIWHPGIDESTCTHGGFVWFRHEASATDLRLSGVVKENNDQTLRLLYYPYNDNSGGNQKIHYMRVPLYATDAAPIYTPSAADRFEDTNGTVITSHSAYNITYTGQNGLEIQNNRLVVNTTGSCYVTFENPFDATTARYIYMNGNVDYINNPNYCTVNYYFREVDNNNWFRFELSPYAARLRIEQRLSGSYYDRDVYYTGTWSDNMDYTLEMVVRTDAMWGYVRRNQSDPTYDVYYSSSTNSTEASSRWQQQCYGTSGLNYNGINTVAIYPYNMLDQAPDFVAEVLPE